MPFRTDLAAESCLRTPNLDGVCQISHTKNGFPVTETVIQTENAAAILEKPQGKYVSLSLGGRIRREDSGFSAVCETLCGLIRSLLPETAQGILVVGLGNRAITPDAVGPLTVEHVVATRHLIAHEPRWFADWRPVSAVAPGVLGQTGVETGEIVRGLVEHVKPDAVIAVDALAAGRISHLMRTIQCTDAGIVPGAGVDNARTALDRHTLGVPVIAIGGPTVVDGATIAHEITHQLGGAESEALTDLSSPVLVTTRDIDREVADTARIIGYVIDLALHPHLGLSDIELCLG